MPAHPLYADPASRAELFSLLDTAWPGLSRKLEVAARLGWPWDAVTTPFVSRAGDRLASPHDLLMVRGDWPELPPFCAGQLASH